MPLFFWSNLFLEARAEIKNNFVGFLVQTRTKKFAFEIIWPLSISFCPLSYWMTPRTPLKSIWSPICTQNFLLRLTVSRRTRLDITIRRFTMVVCSFSWISWWLKTKLYVCDYYVPQWWVKFDNELSWMFTKIFRAFCLIGRK